MVPPDALAAELLPLEPPLLEELPPEDVLPPDDELFDPPPAELEELLPPLPAALLALFPPEAPPDELLVPLLPPFPLLPPLPLP